MISNIFSQTIFFSLRFLTFALSTKKFKAKKKETFERKKRKENYQFVSLKNISIDRGTNRGQKKFLCNRSDSYDTCAVNARRSTGSISLYRCGVYIGLFAMLVDVSCVRGVKWAAWHLQLQPLGLNKGRSLAAFPTQLSPFYHGFHSCFISSVSLHRVHTMRRHLGRVHSSVFSIFFPSCFWLLLFSSLLFFSSSSFALLPQTSPSPTGTHDSSVATHSQIVPASSLNFYDHGGVARTWSHLQIGFRFQFRSYCSSRLFLYPYLDWDFFDRFDPSMEPNSPNPWEPWNRKIYRFFVSLYVLEIFFKRYTINS